MPKRSPEEIWRRLVDEAGEDEIEQAAGVSVAQAEKDLAQAGFDVAAERAKADALMRELEAEAPVSGKMAVVTALWDAPIAPVTRVPEPERKERKRSIVLVAIAILVAGAMTVLIPTVLIPLLRHDEINADRWEASTPSRKEQAVILRRHAADACREHRWDGCRQALDGAQGLDPAGEETPEVRTLRKALEEATTPPPAPPTSPDKSRDIKNKAPDIK